MTRLRRPTADDVDAMFRIHGDPRTNEHYPDGPVIGFCGVRHGTWLVRPVLNLGYRFAPEAWGRGLASSVAAHGGPLGPGEPARPDGHRLHHRGQRRLAADGGPGGARPAAGPRVRAGRAVGRRVQRAGKRVAVPAPDSLTCALVSELPALPDGLTARPLRAGDMAAVADLLASAEPLDRTGEHEDAEGLAEFLVNDRVDLGRDTRAVLAGEELVGYASTVDLGDHRDEYAVNAYGCVHPRERGRGVGRALLEWQLARCGELHRERHPEMPGRFGVNVPEANTSLERLVRRAGFEPVQYYFLMRRPLSDLPSARSVDAVELVPFDPDRDEEVRLAHNRAFRDHFGTAERDAYAWQTWFTGQKAFRPEVSRLALSDGAVLGYVLVYEHDADTAATGLREAYFGQIGVLPEGRGRGLASALITASLRAAAEDRMDRASLTVDTNNTTGALQLYERLGFAVDSRETVWAYRVPAVSRP